MYEMLVGAVTPAVLLFYRNNERLPDKLIIFVIVIGMADFLNAFFFGFFSSPVPLQIFFPAIENKNINFQSCLQKIDPRPRSRRV
jgi:hypothetical protein